MAEEATKTNKDFAREFDKCPSCGSKERFFEDIVRELRQRGLARENWNFYLDMKQGIVSDPIKEASILIGAEIPAYSFATDICSDCGCIYVVKLQRLTVKKSMSFAPAEVQLNRAGRRLAERNGLFPFGNNPLQS